MSYSSSVFRVMLSSGFKEANELASSAKAEISLPEDDPEMMPILCQILHHRHDTVPHALEASQILTLAELSDKYDCAVAVKPSVGEWATAVLRRAENGSRGCLLTAACLLQHEALAHRVAVDLILNSRSPVDQIDSMGPGVWPNLLGKRA